MPLSIFGRITLLIQEKNNCIEELLP